MTATIVPCELSSDELLLARNTFDSVVDDYLRAEHQLRQVLSKMGLFAPDDQLNMLMEHFENKISFTNFHQFLMFLKGVHKQPEPEDADTLRAFIALGGNSDRSGNVNADHLRFACKRFDLTIDIDKLIREVDTSRNGTIDYEEFQELWRMGKGQGLPLVITDESKSMGKSFWMDAVRQAHTATAEIEEELSPSSQHQQQQQQDAHSLLNGSTTDHGGSASDLTAQHNNNASFVADHQQQQGSGGAASMTLPEAVGRVHLGVVIGGAATEQQVEEMPKIDQLRNFLEVGDCSGAPPASNNNNNTVEFGRRRQSNQPHAHFSASNVLGSHNDLRHLAQSARLMAGSTSAARRASQSVMMMHQSAMNNENMMMQSSINNNNNLDDNRGNNNNNGSASYLPASSTHFMLRSNNNPNGMNRYEPPLPASDLLPDPNASPAEVLKKAKELMEERKEHRKKYDLKQESADLDEKVAQMAKQRPPVIGGISLPGKRSNDIELPDPYTIGSSGAGLHHPASGRRNQMVSPTRSTADVGSTTGTTSARYSSGSTMGSARGSARRGWK